MNPKKIAEILRNIRGDRTQAEMAELVGVTVSAIANYEGGTRIPRDETKLRYAEISGMPIEKIFYI